MATQSFQTEATPEGRIPTLISLIKRLVYEDPFLAGVFLLVVIPLCYEIAMAAIQGRQENIPLMIVALSAVVIFVISPLIVMKTWKHNNRELGKQQAAALAGEVERRVNREEAHQNRLNRLFDAKINSLQAEQDLILAKSERHEKYMMAGAIKELHETYAKYDKIMPVLEEISDKLEEIDINKDAKEAVALDTPNFQEILKHKETEIKDLLDQRSLLVQDCDDLRQKGGELQTQLTQVATEKAQLEKERNDLKNLIAAKEKFPEAFQEQKVVGSTEGPEKGPEIPQAQIKKALDVVDAMDDKLEKDTDEEVSEKDTKQEETEPKPWWDCPQCEKGNALKVIRCPKCGTSKPA